MNEQEIIEEKNKEIKQLKEKILKLEKKSSSKPEEKKQSISHDEIIEELKQIQC